MSTATLDHLENITILDFERVHRAHWTIERFYRAIKRVCPIERFQVRNKHPIKNNLFCALKAFIKLELMRFYEAIAQGYQVRINLY